MSKIIEVHNISKKYLLGQRLKRHEKTLREVISEMARAPFSKRERVDQEEAHSFWALRDVSFDLNEGEVLGIIGGNGAGKSTLLKILSRITDPTEGEIKIRGRLASLLEVGTGFHPELTGRENVYLNGAILGMKRSEITAKFDEIAAFADLDDFLDTPVKRYSSGMYVRLAFAVAAHLQPEVLVVDEVLAVGDVAFQKKCLGKMSEVSRGGRTVLFVSHNMAAVENLCSRAIVLRKGRLTFDGTSKDAVRQYLKNTASGSGGAGHVVDFDQEEIGERRSKIGRWFRKVELFTENDEPLIGGLPVGAPLKIRVHFDLTRAVDDFHIGISFNNSYNQRVFTAHSSFEPGYGPESRQGRHIFTCEIPSFQLVPGDYSTFLWLDANYARVDEIDNGFRVNVIDADYYGTGRIPRNGTCVMPQRWTLEEVAESAVAR